MRHLLAFATLLCLSTHTAQADEIGKINGYEMAECILITKHKIHPGLLKQKILTIHEDRAWLDGYKSNAGKYDPKGKALTSQDAGFVSFGRLNSYTPQFVNSEWGVDMLLQRSTAVGDDGKLRLRYYGEEPEDTFVEDYRCSFFQAGGVDGD